MQPIESIVHKNVVVTIEYDYDCECPLSYAGDDIIFATWERNSKFATRKYRPFDEPSQAQDWAAANGYEILPLYKYEHGCVLYSCGALSCPWDSGQVGWILFRPSSFGENPKASIELWLEMFSNWCNGACYCYSIQSAEDGYDIDSCSGFIGYDSVKEAYTEALEWAVKREQERQDEARRCEELIDGGWVETQV